MNKQALIAALAETGGMSKVKATYALNTVLAAVAQGLKQYGEVTLSGIGKLKMIPRKARVGRNPNTGAELQIPAKTVLRIKQSSSFK